MLAAAAALVLIGLQRPGRAGPSEVAAPALPSGSCPPLAKLAATQHWFWGSSLDRQAFSDPDYLELLKRQVTVLTPENALKWEVVQPHPDRYDFRDYEQILRFARQSGMKLRGHALVWHEQLPAWLLALSPVQRQQRLREHIATVLEHTRGQITSWDVINEPLAEDGRGLRRSIWFQDLGEAYIAQALRWARRADPMVQLVINDYGLEGDDPVSLRKRQSLLALVSRLQRQQVPLDAIGLQAHLKASPDGPTFATLPDFMAQLRRMGLRVIVSELDINDAALAGDPQVRDHRLGSIYRSFFEAIMRHGASIDGVIQWGLSDRHTWLNQFQPRRDGRPQRPALFDAQLQAKPGLIQLCPLLMM